MNAALFYLYTRSIAGALRQRIWRLRQPRYLLGGVLGAAYFYFYFYRFLFLRGDHGQALNVSSALSLEGAALLLAIALLIFAWIIPGKRTALSFSETEIDWLFSAPLTRRELIWFKLLSAQFRIFFLTILLTFLTGRARQGGAWLHLGGWWMVISAISLHRLGASFALTRLMERGMANWQRRLAIVSGALGLIVLLWVWRAALPGPPLGSGLLDPEKLRLYAQEALNSGPGPWLLFPFRCLLRPYFAPDAARFFAALPGAIAVFALHYWWVLRADISFEEASIAVAQRRAKFLAATERGDLRTLIAKRRPRRPLFRLGSQGWAVPALAWKALLYSGGRDHFRNLGIVALAGVGLSAVLAGGKTAPGVASVLAVIGLAIFLAILLSLMTGGARYLREDLGSMDLLQTYPVAGWQIVSGQLFAQAAVGTLGQWAALAMMTLSLHGVPFVPEELLAVVRAAACGAAILTLPFNLLFMIVPAAALLLWPAWFRTGPQGMAFEATGQRLIMLLGQAFALLVSLIFPALAILIFWQSAHFFSWGAWWPLAAAVVAAAILAGEVIAGIFFLGILFERFDLSSH